MVQENSTTCEFIYGHSWRHLIGLIGLAFMCLALGTLFGFAFYDLMFVEKADFFWWRRVIPIPRLLLGMVGGIGAAGLILGAIFLFVDCYRHWRRRGRLVFTREALYLPDDTRKAQLIPFTSITALHVQGWDESPVELGWADPAQTQLLRLHIRTIGAEYWLWKGGLPQQHAFDQVLRMLIQECPRAVFLIPGMSEPANLSPPGLQVIARLQDGTGEEQIMAPYPDSVQTVDFVQSLLDGGKYKEVEIWQPLRPLTPESWSQTRTEDLGKILLRAHFSSLDSRIAWSLVPLLFGGITLLLYYININRVPNAGSIALSLGALAGIGLGLLIWSGKWPVFRCHTLGLSLHGPFRRRCLHYEALARVVVTRRVVQTNRYGGRGVQLTVHFLARPGLDIESLVVTLPAFWSLSGIRQAFVQWRLATWPDPPLYFRG